MLHSSSLSMVSVLWFGRLLHSVTGSEIILTPTLFPHLPFKNPPSSERTPVGPVHKRGHLLSLFLPRSRLCLHVSLRHILSLPSSLSTKEDAQREINVKRGLKQTLPSRSVAFLVSPFRTGVPQSTEKTNLQYWPPGFWCSVRASLGKEEPHSNPPIALSGLPRKALVSFTDHSC